MKRLVLLVLFTTAFTFLSPAQHDIGVKLNAGVSTIISKFDFDFLTQEFYFEFSWQTGVYYNYHLADHSILGIELLLSKIAGSSKEDFEVLASYGWLNYTIYLDRKISYLCLPLYYGFKTDKLITRLGLQSGYVLKSYEAARFDIPSNMIVLYEDPGKLDIKEFDYGLIIGFFYSISNRIQLEATYYHGLKNIYSGETSESNWRIQQFTAGLRYSIFREEN
ncbi:MAG: PorT family protein [Bacteroidia bacterium]|nr:PorT family protein [Bacteroidia bacterium]